MTRTNKTPFTLAAILAVAVAGMALTAPVGVQAAGLEKGSERSLTKTVPSKKSPDGLSSGSDNRAGKKDIWGDADAFLAKCNAAGGGASTDQDGFPHCEDSNGGNIPIPMEE